MKFLSNVPKTDALKILDTFSNVEEGDVRSCTGYTSKELMQVSLVGLWAKDPDSLDLEEP